MAGPGMLGNARLPAHAVTPSPGATARTVNAWISWRSRSAAASMTRRWRARRLSPAKAAATIQLFSGGQDSATCLAWALERYARVETIAFDYGQRHRVELAVRRAFLDRLRTDFPGWASRLGEDHLIDLSVLGQVSETALTREVEIRQAESGLPTVCNICREAWLLMA